MKGVCIYGTDLLRALQGFVVGGAELQMILLAKALFRDGIPVSIVEPGIAEESRSEDNLRVFGVKGWNDGLPGIRFFSHRARGIIRVLRKTDSAIFYARGLTFLYIFPLYVAKVTGAKFVLAVAHDADLLGIRERYRLFYKGNFSFWRLFSTILPDELAYPIILAGADYVLVQHKYQAELATRRGKKAVLLRNLVDVEHIDSIPERSPGNNVAVVGELSSRKNLDVLIPIIEELPEITFDIVGDAGDEKGVEVLRKLRSFPNVVFHGWLDRASTLGIIGGAKALLNTSVREGFPNTFLEAWGIGTPVISLHVDPDNVIKEFGLGYACDGNLEMIKKLLRKVSISHDKERMRKYVREYHGSHAAVRVFRELLG